MTNSTLYETKDESRLSQEDFIFYLVAALVIRGVKWISTEDQRELVLAIKSARSVVVRSNDYDRLTFMILVEPIFGGSRQVTTMLSYLYGHFAYIDSGEPNKLNLAWMPERVAMDYMYRKGAQNRELWLEAADTCIEHLQLKSSIGIS